MTPIGIKKILSAYQTRLADEYTIEHSNISSWELMEMATSSFFDALMGHSVYRKRVIVICGVGNNGGDGLALCRMLRKKGIYARAVLVKFKDELSPDCISNLELLEDVTIVEHISDLPNLDLSDIVIDSIIGSGLKNKVNGLIEEVVDRINLSGKQVVSMDIPTGMSGDKIIQFGAPVVNADLVISFQRPKLSFFYPEHGSFIKNWEIVDIGLDEQFIQNQKSNSFWIDKKVFDMVKYRPRISHKGTYGHALLMVGALGKMGAAILSSKACLRTGAGLLTTHVPSCGYGIMQIAVPESICHADRSENDLSSLVDLDTYSVVGFGPGVGVSENTSTLLRTLIQEVKVPMVIDADGLNILSEEEDLLADLPPNTILTPHVGEFKRLVGEFYDSEERHAKLRAFSKQNNCIVVLKDAYTVIASPEGDLYFNSSGNQGMATAGSGDVLTGMITALLAQGYPALEAAILGVYFHGDAGDKAAEKKGHHALIASDIIDFIELRTKE
jgi:hydroxyethylthiazole kinase-like uncharacterized protein yjeF